MRGRRADHHNGMRFHVIIQCVPHLARREPLGQWQGDDLARRVNARISAAGDGSGDRKAAVETSGRGLDDILDGKAGILALPTDERPAVILQQ